MELPEETKEIYENTTKKEVVKALRIFLVIVLVILFLIFVPMAFLRLFDGESASLEKQLKWERQYFPILDDLYAKKEMCEALAVDVLFSSAEYQRDFYGICVKAKSKKHNHEALYVEILPDERDPRKLHVDGYINYFKVDTLSEEFIEKAKELEEKYSAPVTLYYIADVVIIMIENEKFDLKPEEIDGNKIGKIEAKVKRKIELITDYIELSELI